MHCPLLHACRNRLHTTAVQLQRKPESVGARLRQSGLQAYCTGATSSDHSEYLNERLVEDHLCLTRSLRLGFVTFELKPASSSHSKSTAFFRLPALYASYTVVRGSNFYYVQPTRHYFSNAVGAVDYVPGAYVYLHWSGAPLSSLEFRGLYIHTRNLLERYQLTAILADHHAMPHAPNEADRNWLLQEWLPQTVQATPFARYAVIPTLNPDHRLHTDGVLRDLSHYVTVAAFATLDEATDWISSPL